MAILARNKKSAEVKFNVYIDPKTDSVYLSSKDEDLNALVSSGFRMKIDKNTLQDQIFRKLMQSLDADKIIEIDPYRDILPVWATSDSSVSNSSEKDEENLNATMGDFGYTWDQASVVKESMETLNEVRELDYSKFSGYQAHTVPLGLNTSPLNNSKNAIWNMESEPHLYITGEAKSGKTHFLQYIKGYLEYKNIEVVELDLSKEQDALSKLEFYCSKADQFASIKSTKLRPASIVFLIDNIDYLFKKENNENISPLEWQVFNLLESLKKSSIFDVHIILAGEQYNPVFEIKTEVFLAKNATNEHKYYQQLFDVYLRKNVSFLHFDMMNKAGVLSAHKITRNTSGRSKNRFKKIVSSSDFTVQRDK